MMVMAGRFRNRLPSGSMAGDRNAHLDAQAKGRAVKRKIGMQAQRQGVEKTQSRA